MASSPSSSSDVTEVNIQKLITSILNNGPCRQTYADYDSCSQNFMFQPHSNSYIEESLLRQASQKCKPFRSAYEKCLSEPKTQNRVLMSATKVPACRASRMAFERCKRTGQSSCEREAEELLYCGLSFLVLKDRHQQGRSSTFDD